jgi:hypothetical protein
VRTISGVKRVTMLTPASRHHIIDAGDRYVGDGYAGERIKFLVIKPGGEMQRGDLRVDLGPVKKERRLFKPIERRVRRMVRNEYRALGRYLVLHDRSRRKRRSGWVRDLPRNMFKVIRRRT